MMTSDKAARLAAIRAANSAKAAPPAKDAKAAPPTASPAAPTPNARGKTQPTPENLAIQRGMRVVLAMLFAVVSGLLTMAIIQIWQPLLRYALPSLEAHSYLSLSRSSALVGYVLLWLSMALGMAISSRAVRVWPGGPAAVDLHRHFSILGLAFALFHVLILLGDTTLNYTLGSALLPWMGASYRPMWVGLLGKTALYMMAIIVLSFYVRSRIGGRWWRRIHYLSFAVFLLSLLHAIFAGTDTPLFWVQACYYFSGASLLGLGVYRVLHARKQRNCDAGRLCVSGVSLDPNARVAALGDRQVALRTVEVRLLSYLMRHAGQALAVDAILNEVWGGAYAGEADLVASYIRRLRDKLEHDPDSPQLILSIPDQGYQFERQSPEGGLRVA